MTTPRRALPPGACDAHAHVFGSPGQFPPRIATAYAMPDAPAETYRAMLGAAGFARGVLVQPAIYADDNSCLVDALGSGNLRGIASLGSDASDDDFERLNRAGVVGLRFVETLDASCSRYRGTVGFAALPALAPRMRAMGWHAELWAGAARVVMDAALLEALGIPVVLGHMGGMSAANGCDDPVNRNLISMVSDLDLWVKLSPCRASQLWPNYGDARDLHAALIAAAPSRSVWGSDWPHVRMGDRTPAVGHLIDLFDEWIANDDEIRAAVFVDNPQELYGFAPPAQGG